MPSDQVALISYKDTISKTNSRKNKLTTLLTTDIILIQCTFQGIHVSRVNDSSLHINNDDKISNKPRLNTRSLERKIKCQILPCMIIATRTTVNKHSDQCAISSNCNINNSKLGVGIGWARV